MHSSGYPTDLYSVEIAGISEALQNLTEAGATEPMVKINVFLSESGLVTVQDAVVHGEIKDTSITGTYSPLHLFYQPVEFAAGKLKSLFGAGSTSETETETGSETAAPKETAGEDGEPAGQIDPPEKKAPPKDTIPLSLTVKDTISLSMSMSEKRISRDRCVLCDLHALQMTEPGLADSSR